MAERRIVGPWTLIEKLGSGGNAVVWRATRDGLDGEVALKVINATKPDKEPYRRFVAEIEFLQSLGDTNGVLRLIDSFLPEEPSSENRPWLAMPIATPIADALAGAELATSSRRSLRSPAPLSGSSAKPGSVTATSSREISTSATANGWSATLA